MINLKNELPVAVHLASGGDARVRTGGQVISFDGVSSGSFQVMNATKLRGMLNLRTNSGLAVLLGYTSPVTYANASWVLFDLNQVTDEVPEGTTVYYATISPDEFIPMAGGVHDTLHLSFYG